MRRHGFTLIELMVVLAVIAVLLTYVTPRYMRSAERAQETALRQNLYQLRDSIDKFYSDRGRYPDQLSELVTLRYLRNVPQDPFTGRSDTWQITIPPSGNVGKVFDVRSGAIGKGADGTELAQW